MSNPNSKCDHMVNPPCRQTQMPSKTSKAMNHSAWEGHSNEKKFLDALTNLMNESWTVVCQMREKTGLKAQYEMSNTEITKRIDEVSKKLEEKYKEVAALEEHKCQLLNKTAMTTSQSVPCAPAPPRQPAAGYPARLPAQAWGATAPTLQTPAGYGVPRPPPSAYRAPVQQAAACPPASAPQRRRPAPAASPGRAADCRPDCQGVRSAPGAHRPY